MEILHFILEDWSTIPSGSRLKSRARSLDLNSHRSLVRFIACEQYFLAIVCGAPVEARERQDDEHAGTSNDMGREYEPAICGCGYSYQAGQVAAHVE